MKKTNLKMRILSMFLCLLMVFTSIPATAFAAEIQGGGQNEAAAAQEDKETDGTEFDDIEIDEIIEDDVQAVLLNVEEDIDTQTAEQPKYQITTNLEAGWAESEASTELPYLFTQWFDFEPEDPDNDWGEIDSNFIIKNSTDETFVISNYDNIKTTYPLEYVEIAGLKIYLSDFVKCSTYTEYEYDTNEYPGLFEKTLQIKLDTSGIGIYLSETATKITSDISLKFVFQISEPADSEEEIQTFGIMVNNSTAADKQNPVKAVLGEDGIYRIENYATSVNYLWLSLPENTTVKEYTLYQGSTSSSYSKYLTPKSTNNVYDGTTYQYYINTSYKLPLVAKFDLEKDGSVSSHYVIVDSKSAGKYVVAADEFTADPSNFYEEDGVTFTEAGQTVTLTPNTTSIGSGDEQNISWTWSSSDSTVALVDSTGKVTSVGGGTATITAKYHQISVSCVVTSTAAKHTIHTYVSNKCSVCGTKKPSNISVKFTLVDKNGEFVTAKDNSTELYQAALTVSDVDCDGTITYYDVSYAAHQTYYTDGINGFDATRTDDAININKFWGISTGEIAYYCNHALVNSLTNKVSSSGNIVAFFYRDTDTHSDVYTYFTSASGKAATGTAKELTVKYAGENAPVGATVTVSDSNGRAAVTTEVGDNGSFQFTLTETGTYTILVNGTTTSGAPVFPSRMTIQAFAPVSAKIYMTVSNDDGYFAKGKSGQEIYRFPITVYDDPDNPDGRVTIYEALQQLHAQECPAGAEGFKDESGFITYLWGENTGGWLGYYFNDVYMNGNQQLKTGTNGREFKDQLLGTEIADGQDYYHIYAYQTRTDSYTYFNPVEETAVAGEAKTFTVYGGNTNGNVAFPEGAVIKVTDSTGTECKELGTTVGSDGTFQVTFPKSGTYTIDLHSVVNESGNPTKGFAPSRCVVKVTAAEATTQKHFISTLKAAPSTTLTVIPLEENVWNYELAVPSSTKSSYIRATIKLSEAAPNGATITASYKTSSGEDASVKLTSGSGKNISTPINTGMTGSSITFTVGVEGNTQTYILNVVRTVDLKINAITDGDGSTFPLYEGQYLVPEATEKIKLTADSYGSELTINGAKAVSGEAFEVIPTWDEDGIFKVTAKSAHGEETKEETLVFKKFKETDELSGICGESATWKLANGVLTISGSGDMQDFASNQGMPWYSLISMIKEVTFDNAITSVGNYSFYGAAALTKVTLPTAVKGIGQEAFSGCTSLESISLPEGLQTLKLKAFYNTGLTEVSIPATVSSVGQYVFSQCKALKSAELTNAMGDYMFQECSLLSQVTFSGTSLTVIPKNAFANCTTLKTLTIPEGVTEYIAWTAGYEVAFYFENVTIPNTLTGIQADTFGDKLTAINVKEDNPNYVKIGKILYTKDKKSLILAEKDLTGEVTVADGAESINDYAFYKVTGITKVVLPDTVKTIGNYSFDHCSGLKTVVLGKGLESIGEAGFGYCTVLTDITLPNDLTTLGQKAFWFCKALKTIEIPEKVTALPKLLFSNTTALESVIFPAGLTSMETNTFYNIALKTIYFRGSSAAWNAVTNRPADGTYEIVYNYGRTDIASITVQPEDRFFVFGGNATESLSITVTKPENVSVSFTWYVNDKKSSSGGTALTTGTRTSEDGLTSYCTPDISAAGTKYYYCTVISTLSGETVESNSRIASVEVAEKLWEGEGTASEPFKLSSAEDVKKLSTYVSEGSSTEGKYFIITKDITLPTDWTPIGTDTQRFAGTIDGKLDEQGNCATITIPEGGKPLFDYVINATIKNLNIKGTRIDGYGLIDHFNGINITSKTTIENIRILSGTQILKSGLLGSEITTNIYAGSSVSYTAEIRNCTVESDVVIGYNGECSKIGSLAGRFIGTVENCESSATVKGVDYVGGLVGNLDNAMGTCMITNSSFHGIIEASGQFAGGIIGGGYEDGALASAPNGQRPSIQGCMVDGIVKGNEAVGGITGGDRLVAQSWGSQYVTGNHFSGTVSGKKYVGGIIGYYCSLNKLDNISANTYSNAETGIGYVAFLDTNVENPGKFDATIVFNTENGTADCPTVQWCDWKAAHNRTDDPLGKNAEDLCKKVGGETPTEPTCYEIKVTGTYKTEYTLGEELDLTGIVITAYWTNDKPETTLSLSEIEITGFDKNTVGTQTVTLSYGSVKAEISVVVSLKDGADSDTEEKEYTIICPESVTYTGSAIKPSVTVKDGDRWLVEGTDYSVTYKNNKNPGTAQVIVKGKGGHNFKETKEFTITACDLSDASISASSIYSQKTLKNPVPAITRNGKKLSKGKDFTLEYENSGTYSSSGTITVTGKGNYEGTIEVPVTIVDGTTTKLLSKVKVSNVKNFKYGEDCTQNPTVKLGKTVLTKDTDYEISYENTEQAGTATMILKGKGNYVGEKRVNFKLTGTSIKKAKVTGLEKAIPYSGAEITADYTLSLNGTELTEGTDYTVSYGKNISAGKAQITFIGKGAYTGSVKKTFTIGKCSLEEADIQVADTAAYAKGGAKPSITITVNGMTLREKSDYTVSYKNNKKVGATATLTIKGKGSFSGKITGKTFTVEKQQLSNVNISAADMYVKNGKVTKFQKVVLTDVDGKKLSAGKDYEKKIIYQDAEGNVLENTKGLKVGDTVTVTVNGAGAYEGSISTTYKILSK